MDAFGIVGGVFETEVALRAVLVQRQQSIRIHPEQGLQHLEVAVGAQRQIGQPRVLPPIPRPPTPVVGIARRAVRRHREERAVELDRIRAPPGTGGHEPLQREHAAEVGRVVLAPRIALGREDGLAIHGHDPVPRRCGDDHLRPLAGGQRIRGPVLVAADDEPQDVAGLQIEQEAVAAADADLVEDAAGRPCGRFYLGLETEVAGEIRRDHGVADLAGELVPARLADADAQRVVVARCRCGRRGGFGVDPTAVPKGLPPMVVGLPALGERDRVGGRDQRVDGAHPLVRRRGMQSQHVDVETVLGAAGRPQARGVEAFGPGRRDHGTEGAVQQRVLAWVSRHALDGGMLCRSHRLAVVMIPADTVRQTGDQRVRFDDGGGALVPWLGAVGHHVAAFDAWQFKPPRPPHLDGGGGGDRPRAGRHHMDHRVVGIGPEADGGAIAIAHVEGAIGQRQFLAERSDGRRGVERHAHLADLEQSAVVVPTVGLADVEDQGAGWLDPGIHGDVAVAQRHRPTVVLARRIPDNVVARGS